MATATMIDLESVEPYGRVRSKVADAYEKYNNNYVVPNFQWLDELLPTIRAALDSLDPVEPFLPKTPSERNKKRGRPKGVQKRESSATKRGSHVRTPQRRSSRYQKAMRTALNETGLDDSRTSSIGDITHRPSEAMDVPAMPPMIAEEDGQVEENHQPEADLRAEDEDQVDIGQDAVAEMEQGQEIIADEVATVEEPIENPLPSQNVDSNLENADEAVEVDEVQEQPMASLVVQEQQEPKTPEIAPRPAAAATGNGSGLKALRSLLPVPKSGRKDKVTTPSGTTPRITPSKAGAMMNRCLTPKKADGNYLAAHFQQMADADAKRNKQLADRVEDTKRRLEERRLKVAKQRMAQQQKDEERKQAINQKYTPATIGPEEKRKMRPRIVDSNVKKTDNERTEFMEKERVKEAERIQRERDELHRLKVMEEERKLRKAPPPQPDVVPKNDGGAAASSSGMTSTPPTNPNLFHQPMDKTVTKVAAAKSKIGQEMHAVGNTSKLANISNVIESYDMTPLRKLKPATASNYDISDLRSSDETDDEDHPRKKIPLWAQGTQLRMIIQKNYYHPPDLDALFGVADMPDLNKMFSFHRKRFDKRTSSAKWDSPIRPHM